MNIETMTELLNRVFLWGAFALLALAVLEKIANLTGQTIIGVSLRPSELATYATMLAVFAVALLLVGIRTELRNR